MPYWADASYLIGLADPRDQWHADAKALHAKVGAKNRLRIHPVAIAEVVVRVTRRAGVARAEETYQLIRDHMDIVHPDDADLDHAMDVVVASDGELSLADGLFVHLMGPKDIVLSFDQGFDGKVKRMPAR